MGDQSLLGAVLTVVAVLVAVVLPRLLLGSHRLALLLDLALPGKPGRSTRKNLGRSARRGT
ncbi:hypothetical protein ACWEOW_00180 [Monashia sp. NPDC004114]